MHARTVGGVVADVAVRVRVRSFRPVGAAAVVVDGVYIQIMLRGGDTQAQGVAVARPGKVDDRRGRDVVLVVVPEIGDGDVATRRMIAVVLEAQSDAPHDCVFHMRGERALHGGEAAFGRGADRTEGGRSHVPLGRGGGEHRPGG